MTRSNPDCTTPDRVGHCCLDLYDNTNDFCPSCYKIGADRLLKAIQNLEEGPVQKASLEELGIDMTPKEAEDFMEAIRGDAPLLSPEAEEYAASHPEAQAVLSFDLPAGKFPFDIIFIDKETKEPYYEVTVTGPGVLDIPPAKQYNVKSCEVLVRYADGSVVKSA